MFDDKLVPLMGAWWCGCKYTFVFLCWRGGGRWPQKGGGKFRSRGGGGTGGGPSPGTQGGTHKKSICGVIGASVELSAG